MGSEYASEIVKILGVLENITGHRRRALLVTLSRGAKPRKLAFHEILVTL